ncbi:MULTISPECIES: UDP-2,3-diacylglucosamine diphosphatase [Rhodomicrobium]|uniref:UDP-2,3-diacylglucosamine diphosphatase n=1 Tax=Rhodomicrobium TaxID=1068 RepID=UPI000B4A557E|nr:MULTISPECIES: UDP-2,3-diacylglucosamine diphosphatase [Rhodomicrobium]
MLSVYDPHGHQEDRDRDGRSFRTLFISDTHLGTRSCQADAILEFLRLNDAETIYLVGDIIDFWRVKRGPVWPQSHNDVLQKLLRKVRKGARIIFIPGNHDEALRDYCGMSFGGIEIHHDFVHQTADGRRILVMHGDEFDIVVRYAKWLAFLGDRSYEIALWCNNPLNWVRRRLGFGYWSLSAYLKQRVKSAVNFIGEFETAIADEAKRREADGVICGHIHHAADRMIHGIRYINCGDWVESCTALAEDHDGQIRLIRWHEEAAKYAAPAMIAAAAPIALIEAEAAPLEADGALPLPPLEAEHAVETRV